MAYTREQLIAWVIQEAADERAAEFACHQIDESAPYADVYREQAAKFDAIGAILMADADLLESATELKRIAREVINSWACVAKANRDFDYIGATHHALDAIVLPPVVAVLCRWTPDDDGVYQTDCGHSFCFDTDGPIENKQRFCGYCGGVLVAEASH